MHSERGGVLMKQGRGTPARHPAPLRCQREPLFLVCWKCRMHCSHAVHLIGNAPHLPSYLPLWGCIGLENTEQARKRPLIGVVVFPLGEVSNMAGTADVLCPSYVARQDGVIQ